MRDPRYRTKRWRVLRGRVLDRWGYRCAVPGCTSDTTRPRSLDVDHIVELKDGGDFWDPTNLQPLCRSHHSKKTRDQQIRRLAAVAQFTEPSSPNA